MRRPEGTLRVLIVDDDPEDHFLTEATLREARRAKFTVEHIYTAEEARTRMGEGGFDVCLLDYALGAIDGVQLFEEVTRAGYTTPTILLSGQDDEDVEERVLQAGLADYLDKSNVNPSSLERSIVYAIERDAARREIVALNQSLEVRVRERTQELEGFCYSVSHDLRAPLRAINSTSAVLLEDFGASLPPEAVAELCRQAEASARLGRLIDDLLQFVRLGQIEVRRVPLDLTALAHRITDELRIDATIAEGLQAMGDPTLVGLVIMNLLDNAAKFCGPKQVCIEFGQEGDAFFVRDQGIGFDPQYAHKLFQPFERLHREGEFPGTGIGLANVKRIVDRHGGRVWAESRPREGATFFFTLG